MANITKRGNGYRIIVSGGYDPNGKRITHTMTWIPDPDMGIRAINKELSIVAADFEKKFKNGQCLDSKIRLSEYVENYWLKRKEKEVETTTYTRYNGQWCSLIDEDVKRGFALDGISKQKDLSVQPLIKNGSRAFVIISDALRYETADELAEKLTREANGTAKLSAVQSVFPSVTKMGVAALLPHNRLTATNEGKVLCDGMPADSTDARDRILKSILTKTVL